MSKRKEIGIDPAVVAILDEAENRNKERTMSPIERKKANRARRKRITWELDDRLVALVQKIAKSYNISPAGTANILLAKALHDFAQGEINFTESLQPSRSPRYEWVVTPSLGDLIPAVEEFLRLDILKGDGEKQP